MFLSKVIRNQSCFVTYGTPYMLLIFKEKKHLYLNSHPQLLPLKSMTSREIISTSYGTNFALSNQLYYYYRRSDTLVHSECVFFHSVFRMCYINQTNIM